MIQLLELSKASSGKKKPTHTHTQNKQINKKTNAPYYDISIGFCKRSYIVPYFVFFIFYTCTWYASYIF